MKICIPKYFYFVFNFLAKYLPPNEVKSNTFWHRKKNQVPLTIKNRSILRKAMERPLGSEKEKKKKVLLNKRVRQLQKKLKGKGIEYDVQVRIIFCELKTFLTS